MSKKSKKKRTFEEVEAFLKKEKRLEGACYDVDRVSTGLPGLDYALGGGLPRGRITEVFGYEDSGKTTLALKLASVIQKGGERVCLWDFEHAITRAYLEACGIDTEDKFKWEQPACLETGLDALVEFIDTGEVGIAVIDSLSSMLPKAELEGKIVDNPFALQSRKISQFLRKVTPLLSKYQTDLLMISHLKDKIGSFGGASSVGGRAPKFYSSVRLQVKSRSDVTFSGRSFLNSFVKVVKNKTAPKRREPIPIPIGSKGIDRVHHIIECLKGYGVIVSKGASYFHGKQSLARGERNLSRVVKKSPKRFVTMLEETWYGNKSKARRDGSLEGFEPEDEDTDVS